MKYVPLIVAVSALGFYLIFSIWPKHLRPKELLRQKHDFSQEISICNQNEVVIRIVEGNIVELGGRIKYKSGEPVMGFKPSVIHKYNKSKDDVPQIMKTKFALNFNAEQRTKIGAPILVCYAKKGVVSFHVP